MAKIRCRELGEIDPRDAEQVEMPEGLIGFERHHSFLLCEHEEYEPFRWLVSMADPDLAFALADPGYFVREAYHLTLNEMDMDLLDLKEGDPLEVLVTVSIDEKTGWVVGDLKGPIIVNRRSGLARQILVYSARHSARQPMRLMKEPGEEGGRFETTVRIVDRRVA